MNFTSNILLGINVILAMVKMEITTNSKHSTVNIKWRQKMQYNNEFQDAFGYGCKRS